MSDLTKRIITMSNQTDLSGADWREVFNMAEELEAKLEEAGETVLKAVAAKGQLEVQLQARVAELEAKIHEATEVYAGMEGFIPETAAEGYCLRIIRQMYSALIGGGDE